MKAYKVVEKTERSSCIASGEYKLYYPKGEIVEAPKGTMGIFCFETLKDAKDFAEKGDMILKVEGIGKPYKPDFVVSIRYPEYFTKYKKLDDYYKEEVREGTICFKKVKVLT